MELRLNNHWANGPAQNALFTGLAASLLFTMSGSGVAQEGVLEEVIVTATKRPISMQDVGVSVAAFSGADIERQGIRDSEELLLKVPGLDIRSNAGSTNANIFLRGIGSTGIGWNIQSGVGIYADEIALNSPVVNILQTYDLERVEVLRGPQNTLYGRNTTGGAINFISRRPEVGGDLNGYASASIGNFNDVTLEAAIGAPIGDKAAFRLSAQSQQRDGIRTNLFTGTDEQDRDKFAVRGQLMFEPTDATSINFRAHVERVRNRNILYRNGGAYAPDAITPDPANPCATPFVAGACSNGLAYTGGVGFVDSPNVDEASADMLAPRNDVDAGGASMHINIDFETMTFTSITAYEENEQGLSEDSDAFPSHNFHFFIESEQEQVSQEFRLASVADNSFRWILGAYYFQEDKIGSTGPTFATGMGTMLVRSEAEFDNTTYSGYFDVEYDISDTFTLKGGYRYSWENVSGQSVTLMAWESTLGGIDITTPSFSGDPLPPMSEMVPVAIAAGVPVTFNDDGGAGPQRVIFVGGPLAPPANIDDTDFNEWGGKFGADWRPTDDVLVYAQWSRGFKAGRFPDAPMATMNGLGDTAIEPEIVEAYEIGIKSDLAEGRVRLNAAAFFNDYQDQQLNQFINGEFSIVNVDSEILGAEVELNWLPIDNLHIDAGIAVLDSEITDSLDPNQVGKSLIFAPDFTGRASIRYDWELGSASMFGVGLDGRYSSERFFTLTNDLSEGSFSVFNAQAYYEFGREGQYRLTAWGKNIFDEEYVISRFAFEDTGDGFTDYHTILPSEQRTYGITFKVDF